MPTITNFGDVVTQGNTTATGNLTVQGTGTSSFSGATSAVTMAGTLAVTGVTTHSSNIIPNADLSCGIGTAAQRFNNIFSANVNVYTTANILTVNAGSINAMSNSTFQANVFHFQNTYLSGFTTTTGVVQPSSNGVSGIGAVTLLFANAYLQTANIGSGTTVPLQQAMNITGNVFISNSINVTNVLSVTTNASFLNVLTSANIYNLNVLTSGNTTYLSVTTLANVANANILTSNHQFLNAVTANILNLNVSTGANTTYLNVSQIANIANANILTANMQFLNVVTANILNLNVLTGANTTYLNVSQIANVANANILTANMQFSNTVFSNILNLNVSTGANTTYLTVSTFSNIANANIVTANHQFLNTVTANLLNLNVSTGANTTYLTVSTLSNIANANILTANNQFLNVVTANILNLNVYTGANTTYLNVSQIANVSNANVLTANMQFLNVVTSNLLNLNVSTGTNTTYLTVSTLANAASANIVTANHQFLNTVTSNLLNLNVSTGANTTYLTVSTFSNIISANIVTQFTSNINVSSNANLFNANIFTANVQSVFNAVYAVMTANFYGNASGVSNLNLSNVNNGTIPFSSTPGSGAAGISINGVTGSAGQFLTATGTGSAIQWGGPAATVIWAQVTGFVSPPIYYAVSNVGIGGPYSTMSWGYGTSSVNQYPGTPLDVYGGTGSFSNLSDATYTGTIRIQQNAGSWLANGGLEFKTGTDVNGSGHRIVTTQDPTIGSTPLIFQVRAKTKTWSNAVVINCDTTATSGYVGIGTMVPLYQLHIYQPNSSATIAGALIQASSASQQAGYSIQNSAAGTCVFYLNGASPSDGPANSATIRNNAGDLRLTGASTQPYIYLQSSTNSVGFGTQTMVASSNISFWCPNVSSSGFAHTVSADSKLGVSLYAGDPGQGQFVITGITNTNKRLAFMYDTSNNISLIQSMTAGTGTNTLILNGAGGNVGVGLTTPPRQFSMYGEFALVSPYAQSYFNVCDSTGSNGGNYTLYIRGLGTNGTAQVNMAGCYIYATNTYLSGNLGVAVASPSDLIHVYGTSNPSIRIDAGTGGTTDPRLQFYSGTTFRGRVAYSYGGGYMYYQNDTQDVMRFYNGANGSVTLQPIGGYVGVTQTSPLARVHITGDSSGGSGYGNLLVDYPNSTSSGGCITIRNSAGGTGAFASLAFEVDGSTAVVSGNNATPASFNQGNGFLYCQNVGAAYGGSNAGKMGLQLWSGSAETEVQTWLPNGYVGIGNASPATKLHISNGDSSTATFGPNATWGSSLRVGSGNQYNSGTSGLASIITTNGNLHIDCGTGQALYLNYFTAGAGVGGPTNSYGAWTHTGTMSITSTQTVTGVLTGNGGYSGYGTQNYFGGYAGTNGNGFDFEDQGTFMRMAQRNIRWYDWSGAGDFLFVQSGCVGIRTSQTSSVFETAGRSYFWGSNGYNAGGGQNRFTGLEADSSANGRAQIVLNSAYSDMIICSSQGNGNHGSTISFTTASTAFNTDGNYRKFVINQNNWLTDSSGTGGYGDRLIFDWLDGAYTNPHSVVGTAGGTLTIYGRGKSLGINYIRTPGYNLHISGNDYATGGRYTSDFFRVYGGGGMYWQDYGGGWFMSDTTYMRVYNDKWIYTGGSIQSASAFRVGDGRVIIDSSYNHYGWFRPYNDAWHYCNSGYRRFFFATAGRTYIEGNNGVEIRRSDDTYVAVFNDDLSIDFRSTVRMNGQLQTQGNSIAMGSGVLYFQNSSQIWDDSQLKISTDDNIYFYATNDFHFYNGGAIRCDADIIAYASDERIKTRLGVIDNALDKVKQLTGFYYEHNELGKKFGFNDGGVKVGVSAQEVQKVMPEVVKPAPFDFALGVSTSGENYLTVQYEKLVPLLIESIKELSEKLEKLEKIISSSK